MIKRQQNVALFCASFSFLLMLGGCTVPGGNQKISKIRLSIQNTLPIERKQVPIVLTGEQLRKVNPDFSFNAYSVVIGKAPREVLLPAQADDIDYDGQRDQLTFLVDLAEDETKEVSILYDPTVKAELTLDIKKQTRAGIFPELNAVAAMESNLIAYLLRHDGGITAYGKKRAELFSVDSLFESELDAEMPLSPGFRQHFESHNIILSEQVSLETERPLQQWVITDFQNQESYFVRKAEGQLNISKSIGLSLGVLLSSEPTTMVALTSMAGRIGCGGVALWDKEKSEAIPLPEEGDYVRILANGAIRSIVQRIFPEWTLYGERFQLTSTFFIYGESPWIEHHLYVKGSLPAQTAVVTGIPDLESSSNREIAQGWIWSWRESSAALASLGVSLMFPPEQVEAAIETEMSHYVTLFADAGGRFYHRACAIWGGGIDGIETEIEFAQYVQTQATAMKTPPTINFLRPEGEE